MGHQATGSMPAKPEEENRDEVPAVEPEINEPSDDVPTPPAEVDDALAEDMGAPAEGEGNDNPVPGTSATPPAPAEGEQDPNGPDPVVEPVNE